MSRDEKIHVYLRIPSMVRHEHLVDLTPDSSDLMILVLALVPSVVAYLMLLEQFGLLCQDSSVV